MKKEKGKGYVGHGSHPKNELSYLTLTIIDGIKKGKSVVGDISTINGCEIIP
jgi:hypothetical protein